ncbi:uncharacterized protein LOC129608023 [Condylostylus longicornis]|uniref:uncharacterized protein LOC129608023 n=1 Tax=Condylostylus longicornis TaxID=2530218 RepID=UPI00244E52FB|nr:uncharacterized protein LOC129608023 [Condylostylus longicornis]
MAEEFEMIVKRVFNNWTGLRLAVENGMGGRNGQKTAIEMMEYVYQYCMLNQNLDPYELEGIIEEMLDEEFNTICEDNSVKEIASILFECLGFYKSQNIQELKNSFLKMPSKEQWLIPNASLRIDVTDSDSDTESEMEVDEPSHRESKKEDSFVEPEEGWTTVRRKK